MSINSDISVLSLRPNINFDIYVDNDGEKIKISKTKQLYDIAGNPMTVYINNQQYNVMVKYQDLSIYGVETECFYAM